MASLIPQMLKDGVQKLRGKSLEASSSYRDNLARSFSSLTLEQKLSKLYQEYRTEDMNGRLLLNRTWFRTALYFQGKQQVAWNNESNSLEWFDPVQGEDWYTENQFRQAVETNVAALCKSEIQPSIAPGSDRPDDVAAARAAEAAYEVICDDVGYDRNTMLKNQMKCIFGNAFRYQTFVRDSSNGESIIAKFKFEDSTIPGVSICPSPGCGVTAETQPAVAGAQPCASCGSAMTELSPEQTISSKVDDGTDTVPNGRNLEIITGPLEMYMRSKVLHGLKYQPYLFWVRRMASDTVIDARPNVDLTGGVSNASDGDLGSYYVDVLSTLSGGSYEGVYRTSGTRNFREVEYAMCWIRPEAFKGDTELKKKYPDGVQFETCNGKFIEGTDDSVSMDSCWTHEVYIVNPYSAWGEGMVDALPVQDQINETNSLTTRYLRNCTVGKVVYDAAVITPEWLSNHPNEAWIQGNVTLGSNLAQAVHAINPVPMSQDVGMWLQRLSGSMQDMTWAFNAQMGKSNGANTPYSADVFQAEQAMGRFLPMFRYNHPSIVQAVRQQLALFQENATEERTKRFRDNTGRWSFEKFMGSDLAQGSFDIMIVDAETAPKSKAERAKGLEMFIQIAPLMPALSQKQRIYVLDMIGMPPDANPDTLMSEKAYRDIDTIVVKGQPVTPLGFILDIPVYVKTIKEYLASEQGDALADEQPQVFAEVVTLMVTAMMMGQQMMMMPSHGQPPAPGAPQGGPPQQGAPPQGAQGAPQPKPPQTESAQSPVPDNQKQPMPPLPAGARQ